MYPANADTEDIFINGYINGLSEAQTGRHMLSFLFIPLGSEDVFVVHYWKN